MTSATVRYLNEEIAMDWDPMTIAEDESLDARRLGGRAARILLAEDDTEMRSMLSAALRSDGYEVVEASSGSALLEEISMLLFRGEAIPADLIVSDERMPGLSGSEVLAGLRRACWPTPFILITGFGDHATHRQAFRLGASAVFDKPFDLDELRQTIVGLLQRTTPSTLALEPPRDSDQQVDGRMDEHPDER